VCQKVLIIIFPSSRGRIIHIGIQDKAAASP